MTASFPLPYSLTGKRVWVAGHRGMVGSAIVRRLQAENCEIVTIPHAALDLTRQDDVEEWLMRIKPHAIFHAAARVGGILANSTYPAEFLHDNLAIQTSVIEGARKSGVEKLLMLGSSCIYPKFAEQPIAEDALLTGPLEPTNEWYAIAKIAGLKLAQAYRVQYGCDFISAMPTSLYGPGDNFDLQSGHVLPALLRKTHEAKLAGAPSVTMWGTGTPRREFMHVDDCADALVHLMRHYSSEGHINVGTGQDITIAELTAQVCRVVGFSGHIERDPSKPDGTPRKLLNIDRLTSLGWTPRIPFPDGLAQTYRWYLEHQNP